MATKVEETELAVFECEICGFHIGLDTTYISQIGDINISCPIPDCEGVFDTETDKELL